LDAVESPPSEVLRNRLDKHSRSSFGDPTLGQRDFEVLPGAVFYNSNIHLLQGFLPKELTHSFF